MAELEIAKHDMYGYRQVMPDHRTRVRVYAGTPIPPDLVDLEKTDEIAPDTLYDNAELTAATMSEEDQVKLQEERNASTLVTTGKPAGDAEGGVEKRSAKK